MTIQAFLFMPLLRLNDLEHSHDMFAGPGIQDRCGAVAEEGLHIVFLFCQTDAHLIVLGPRDGCQKRPVLCPPDFFDSVIFEVTETSLIRRIGRHGPNLFFPEQRNPAFPLISDICRLCKANFF